MDSDAGTKNRNRNNSKIIMDVAPKFQTADEYISFFPETISKKKLTKI